MTNPTRSYRHMALEAIDFTENHAGGQAKSVRWINLANILISRDIFYENANKIYFTEKSVQSSIEKKTQAKL